MDERKATVLRAVVESFIDTAQPVGSRAVTELSGLDVSAATIRNDMAVLEAEGFLTQPHTSAGRIPTEAGYRAFVDALGPGRLDATETRQVRAFFEHAQGQIEQRLVDTSKLLSQLTTYAAVIVGPTHEQATVRSAQLVELGGGRVMSVVVTSTGAVERSLLELDSEHGPASETVVRASQVLQEALLDCSVGSLPMPGPVGEAEVDELVAAAAAALGAEASSSADVYVGGASNMAAQFDAISTVRSVLTVLEEQLLVVSLLGSLVDRGLSVAIGSETGVEPLAECAVVVAPYAVDGEPVGSIGLLGPTRMDYPRALAAVEMVSSRLGESLGESNED